MTARTSLRRSTDPRVVAALVTWLTCGACSSSPGDGELGNDRFLYRCVHPNDAACDTVDGTTLEEVPIIARGATFRLVTEDPANMPECPSMRLVAVAGEPVTYRAEMAGFAAVFARDPRAFVRDLFHVEVARPTSALLLQRQGSVFVAASNMLTVPVGSTTELRVVPLDASGRALAGALDWTWTSTPSTLLGTVAITEGNVVVLSPTQEVNGELRVEAPGGLVAAIAFDAKAGGGS
jgi:hypothetical protein